MAMIPVATLFAACDDTQEGTEPGGDSQPNVVLYQYTADDGYNSDVTTKVRLACNSATEAVYLLSETEADYKAHYSGDDEAYADYVVDNGEKTTVSDNLNIDYNMECPAGLNYITAVAVKGGEKHISATVSFTSNPYSQVAGTEDYIFQAPFGGTCQPQLMRSDLMPNLYRLKGVSLPYFGEETFDINFSVYTVDREPVVVGGYTYLRVLAHGTPYEYGTYGTMYLRDVAAYMNDESYVVSNYGCVMTEDYQLDLILQFYVSAGNIGLKEAIFGPAE